MKFGHLWWAAAILVSASSTAMAARPIVRCPINAIDDQARRSPAIGTGLIGPTRQRRKRPIGSAGRKHRGRI